MSGTLLSYAFVPSPNPLQAGTEAALTLGVANDGSQLVEVSSIVVVLPVGPNAEDLTEDPGTVETEVPDGWSVEQQGGAFTLTPDTPALGTIGRDGLAFRFSAIAVNDQPGPFLVPIDETASSRSEPSAARTASLPLAKFPVEFSVGDLTADPLEVEVGASTTLMWEGSPASYTLEFDADGSGRPTAVPVGDVGPYVTPALTARPVVVFTLVVEVSVPGSDQPLVVQRQATVSVAAPAPTITAFGGSVEQLGSGRTRLELAWSFQGVPTGDLTGFPSPVNPSGSAPIAPTVESPLRSSYTLTVANRAGSAESTVTLEWGAGPSVGVQADPWAVAVSPDNRLVYVVSADMGTVTALAVDSLEPVAQPAVVGVVPTSIAVSPDGSRLYVAGYAGTVWVLDAASLTQVGQPIAVGSKPSGMTISPDGSLVLVANSGDDTVTAIDTATAAPTSVPVPPQPYQVAVSPDGTRVYAVTLERMLAAFDSATFAPIGSPVELGSGDPVKTAAVVAGTGGSHVFAALGDGSLWAIDAATLQPVGEPLALGGQPGTVALSLDGALLFVSDLGGSTVSVVDATAFEVVGAIPVGAAPMGVCVAADGSRVFVTDAQGPSLSVLVPVAVTGGKRR